MKKNIGTYIRYLIESRSEEDDNTLSKEIIYCLSSGELGEYSANKWANKRLKKPSTSVALLTFISTQIQKINPPLSDPSPKPLTSASTLEIISFRLFSSSSMGFLPSPDLRAFWNGPTKLLRSSSLAGLFLTI